MTSNMRATGLAFLVIVTALLQACASSPKPAQADYRELYSQHRYAEAYKAALEAETEGSSVQKEQAALIAGLSAAALGKNDQAEKILRPLLKSGDQTVSGKAAAQLGLIAYEQDRHAEASELLTEASNKLTGDEAARASLYAGDTFRAQGRASEARASYERAQSQVQDDSTLKVLISDRLAAVTGNQSVGSGQFTVQLGAFSSFQRAQVQADRYRTRAQSAGYPSPRIVQTTSQKGVKVYAVRVGRFQNRGAAEAVQQKLGTEAKITTASGE
ncbi:MAG: tetratricopeptide repeat protein [Phycisphaeraceae bacterium]|nr:tetratricopeptide repeat protein [Phycisphaeraceae bacterium]